MRVLSGLQRLSNVGRIRRLRRIRHKNRLSLSERGESPSDYRV
ncbi:hypothetical protein HMPREF9541_00248 [Escherichia coli MS 116-1]|uniref:Uncharacterized protein n=1 Tax=Escherichia coli MS 85-1 TaxID=679202 RepID=A0AAN3SEA5_ECOLX|nr:hypothetical protein HMPREF9551_00368 [Escherichia coli MS 196-1]EFK17324.1 hypothetical protein HMPREF9541_00248 [Escherichia coli MS 116-1]EFK50425.1 hypothetical protein HMPREF9345_03032 [Escherichia coli MS 107-1]EFU34673.1 hypothetical protein HMPREF9350_03440 [Escherichia coli MS 85-1]EGU98869.1 hypothetical protein HMPREF9349_01099 [Escherichia coli MS 79-10]ESE00400.1 hypothetical protein HMPREF1616_04244 [Escherichia coli 908658]